MGYKNREIEWKLLCEDFTNMSHVDKIVKETLSKLEIGLCRPILEGCATDVYWPAPEESRADFVRLRTLDEADENGCTAQITLKKSDRGDNVNRVEVDLAVGEPAQGNKLLTVMLGDPLGQVTKRYTVYFLENVHTTISVYKVLRDRRVFVEVEGTTLKRVKELTKLLMDNGGLKFKRSPRSLFDIFVRRAEPELEPVVL